MPMPMPEHTVGSASLKLRSVVFSRRSRISFMRYITVMIVFLHTDTTSCSAARSLLGMSHRAEVATTTNRHTSLGRTSSRAGGASTKLLISPKRSGKRCCTSRANASRMLAYCALPYTQSVGRGGGTTAGCTATTGTGTADAPI